jgi:hypothetical protein
MKMVQNGLKYPSSAAIQNSMADFENVASKEKEEKEEKEDAGDADDNAPAPVSEIFLSLES